MEKEGLITGAELYKPHIKIHKLGACNVNKLIIN